MSDDERRLAEPIRKKILELERLIERDNRQRAEMLARIMGKLAELRAVGLNKRQVAILERAAQKRGAKA